MSHVQAEHVAAGAAWSGKIPMEYIHHIMAGKPAGGRSAGQQRVDAEQVHAHVPGHMGHATRSQDDVAEL